jgi:hypothetical protein
VRVVEIVQGQKSRVAEFEQGQERRVAEFGRAMKTAVQLAVLMLGMQADLPRHVPLDHSDGMKSVGKTNTICRRPPLFPSQMVKSGVSLQAVLVPSPCGQM